MSEQDEYVAFKAKKMTINAEQMAGRDQHIYINKGYSASEAQELFEALKREIDSLDIPSDIKARAVEKVDAATAKAKGVRPDKQEIALLLEETGKLLENATQIILKTSKLGTLLSKGLIWAGNATGWF